MAWDDSERASLVALLRARPNGLNWPQIAAEVAEARSAQAVWLRHSPEQLFPADEDTQDIHATAVEDVAAWRNAIFRFLTFMDSDYPARLRDVHQAPPILFTRGELRKEDVGISIVGSRSASVAGLSFADQVACRLVERHITVISGLAAGIDTSAHTATLRAGGRTVAVIGTGILRAYPAENLHLQEQIARDGLLLSQFWPDSPPTKTSFPIRNATMSAYGHATIVVEASEKSGARIQARVAIEHGRPVILSRMVAYGTNWGRRMIGRPGVHIANDPAEAVDFVQQILDRGLKVSDLLATLDQ